MTSKIKSQIKFQKEYQHKDINHKKTIYIKNNHQIDKIKLKIFKKHNNFILQKVQHQKIKIHLLGQNLYLYSLKLKN